jgi:hypothetical protein
MSLDHLEHLEGYNSFAVGDRGADRDWKNLTVGDGRTGVHVDTSSGPTAPLAVCHSVKEEISFSEARNGPDVLYGRRTRKPERDKKALRLQFILLLVTEVQIETGKS